MFKGLGKFLAGAAELVKEAFKDNSLPAEVAQDLRDQGYRTKITVVQPQYSLMAMDCPSAAMPSSRIDIVSPDGVVVNSSTTPVDVQKDFEAAVRASYDKHEIKQPEFVPGSYDFRCAHPEMK